MMKRIGAAFAPIMAFAILMAVFTPLAPLAARDLSAFETGPVFEDFGPHAPVDGMAPLPADTRFAIAFDVAEGATEGKSNRSIESAARFINMHVANGVDPANIKVVIVVHGAATIDLLTDKAWATRERGGDTNPSAAMLTTMMEYGVRVILCGQSGAANGVTPDELLPGVETALSAMTAHALLQQDGYTVNPF